MTRAGSVADEPACARGWRKRQDVVPLVWYWHQVLDRDGDAFSIPAETVRALCV